MFVFYNVFGLSYWLSSASNYFFGSILSYFLNKYFTFQYKKRDWKVVVRFVVNVSVCYLIAYGIAKPLIRALMSGFEVTAQENVAMICGMGLFVALNYLGQRFLHSKQKNEQTALRFGAPSMLSRHYRRVEFRPGKLPWRLYFKGHKAA